jgi:hypothetical protein
MDCLNSCTGAELYPTSVRSTGFGLLAACGRISSFLSTLAAGALLEVKVWAPLVMAAGLLAIGCVAMMTLPESAGRALEDVVDVSHQPSDCVGDHDKRRLINPRRPSLDMSLSARSSMDIEHTPLLQHTDRK